MKKYTVFRRPLVIKKFTTPKGNYHFYMGEELTVIAHTNWWLVAHAIKMWHNRHRPIGRVMLTTIPLTKVIKGHLTHNPV